MCKNGDEILEFIKLNMLEMLINPQKAEKRPWEMLTFLAY